ncbi:MAG: hypothetical protein WDN08_03615 [Rhizomicrobium sp.]
MIEADVSVDSEDGKPLCIYFKCQFLQLPLTGEEIAVDLEYFAGKNLNLPVIKRIVHMPAISPRGAGIHRFQDKGQDLPAKDAARNASITIYCTISSHAKTAN